MSLVSVAKFKFQRWITRAVSKRNRFQISEPRRIGFKPTEKMANLDDLPPEIRSKILEFAMETYIIDNRYATAQEKFSFACNLSLVSRAMNSTAAEFIFYKYRLDIRQKVSKWQTPIYPPESERFRWDEDAIAQRLAHLRSKAEHVRDIVLEDYGPGPHSEEAMNDPPAFPPQLMPSLMAALRTLRYVTGVTIITGDFDSDVSLPSEFWDWIQAARPHDFTAQGSFETKTGDMNPPLESVATYKVISNYEDGL
ncbi:hypothetical protein H0H81_010954 [Sphagnurus paluster]|uniref:Uncharacterized protein n=1 Tax=Sphagnurus paluster TaxID=117069 RepID=A0A9P7K2F8_9AGAR|nr:hypothetical protein H0H81_010954 [Sphagnurus paluster]